MTVIQFSLVATLGLAQLAPLGQSSERVSSAILEWEKKTKINVDVVPEREMPIVVPNIIKSLDLRTNERSPAGYEEFVIESVTQDFLYWSRDQSKENIVRLGETTVLPQRITAFLQQRQSIKGRDVGKIHVTSDPNQGQIQIDKEDKGRTEGTFVSSVGSHVVSVTTSRRTCNQSVNVSAGATVEVDCR